jgi:prepilin-type processing-associated H-X9-DG protein
MKTTGSDRIERAFSRSDLMAAGAMVFVLLLLGASTIAGSKSDSDATICVGNHRALIQAWTDFTADNDGKFPGALQGGAAADPDGSLFEYGRSRPFTGGWITWGTDEDNTNFNYFANPRYGALANYLNRRKDVIKCPADTFLSPVQRDVLKWTGRVRSYSGNIAVGEGNAETGPWSTNYLHATKISQLVNPSPAGAYVYVEEHPDSINDGGFFNPRGDRSALTLVDVPVAYHDGATAMSYADGHADLHRWRGGWRTFKVSYIDGNVVGDPPGAADMQYLFDHTPKPASSTP